MKLTLNDKIKGAIYGCAYGDTLGIGTEFMTKPEAAIYYPGGLREFDKIILDAHRILWPKGKWSHDTAVMSLLLETGIANGDMELPHLTRAINKWVNEAPVDIAPYFYRLITDPEWLDNAIEVSERRWNLGDKYATNECIQHAITAAFICDDDDYQQKAREIALMTHYDTRCEVTSLISAIMARSLLFTGIPAEYDWLERIARDEDPRVLPYLEIAKNGELEDLDLDDEDTLAWTRKCMASALWTVWHCDNATDAIHLLVDEAGDADTNAALAGTFAGLRYGYDAIPKEKENIIGREYLDDLADRLTTFVHNKFSL